MGETGECMLIVIFTYTPTYLLQPTPFVGDTGDWGLIVRLTYITEAYYNHLPICGRDRRMCVDSDIYTHHTNLPMAASPICRRHRKLRLDSDIYYIPQQLTYDNLLICWQDRTMHVDSDIYYTTPTYLWQLPHLWARPQTEGWWFWWPLVVP